VGQQVTAGRVAGLLLAAGGGSRYGMPKALVPTGDGLMAARALRTLREGGLAPIVAVIGAAADEVRASVAWGDAVVVDNPQWRSGMGSSLRAGLAAMAAIADVDAIVVLLVDTPGITPAAVQRLVRAARAGTPHDALLAAAYHGRQGHPVLIGRAHWAGVARSAVGDTGAKPYLRAHATDLHLIACEDIADGTDIDVPAPDAARRWREALAQWEIPAGILAGAAASPWTLPVPKFVGRAQHQLDAPSGVSYEVAVQALPEHGTVLDVGAGAGAASLALRARTPAITAVDERPEVLVELADLAAAAAVPVATLPGTWPRVSDQVSAAHVVLCHHVLYNAPDLVPFVEALTAHALRRVVVEITPDHPMSALNPLWRMLHRVERPTGPTAADAIEVIAGTGVRPRWRAWQRPITQDGTSYEELVASTARRLCLPAERRAEVDAALRACGAGPDRPYLGDPTRNLVTVWWDV
jgi:CTP:molybdopterin cytidylyltransferase MocA/SAM-dependent methyltransferase